MRFFTYVERKYLSGCEASCTKITKKMNHILCPNTLFLQFVRSSRQFNREKTNASEMLRFSYISELFSDSFVCIEILIDMTNEKLYNIYVFLCSMTPNTDFYYQKVISRKFQNSTPLPWLYFRHT
jgi:hypothetical protein